MKSVKKILLVVMLAVATIASANAEFRFGIKAGLNVNKMHFNNDFAQKLWAPDNSTGWTGGVMMEFTVPIIGIGMDASLMYTRMNNSSKDEVVEYAGDETVAEPSKEKVFGRNFLEIPINLKYKINIPVVASIVKPYVFTGPSFAFKLDKNVIDDIKTHTCEVAWNVGLGVELFKHVQVGASYAFGINDLASKVAPVNGTQVKIRNNYWTVTAAYLF